jgi:hypothetical protein
MSPHENIRPSLIVIRSLRMLTRTSRRRCSILNSESLEMKVEHTRLQERNTLFRIHTLNGKRPLPWTLLDYTLTPATETLQRPWVSDHGCVSKNGTVLQVYQRKLLGTNIGLKCCQRGRLSEVTISKYHDFQPNSTVRCVEDCKDDQQ